MSHTYEIVAVRRRHRKGFYGDYYELRRDDGKVVAVDRDLTLIEKVRRRFQTWDGQGWPYVPDGQSDRHYVKSWNRGGPYIPPR